MRHFCLTFVRFLYGKCKGNQRDAKRENFLPAITTLEMHRSVIWLLGGFYRSHSRTLLDLNRLLI
jgi:hypothetical protein